MRPSSFRGIGALDLVGTAILLGMTSCTPGPLVQAVEFTRPPMDAPTTECQVGGDGNLGSGFHVPLFKRKGSAPVAHLAQPARVHVLWKFPAFGESLARVRLGGQRLVSFEGWAPIGQMVFQVRNRVELIPTHLWLARGGRVRVEGVAGRDVIVSWRMPFPNGRLLYFRTSCGNLVYSSTQLDEGREQPGQELIWAIGRRGLLPLYDAPGGTLLLEVEPEPGGGCDAPVVQGRRGDWVRIRYGWDLVVDAWARMGDVELVPARKCTDVMAFERAPVDPDDRCPPAYALRDTPIFTDNAPGAHSIGQLERGAALIITARTSDMVGFEFPDGQLKPSPGGSFWAKRSDVSDTFCEPTRRGSSHPAERPRDRLPCAARQRPERVPSGGLLVHTLCHCAARTAPPVLCVRMPVRPGRRTGRRGQVLTERLVGETTFGTGR